MASSNLKLDAFFPNRINPTAPEPPLGRGGGPSFGQTPFGGYELQPGLSPEEKRSLEISIDSGVSDRIRRTQSIAPSVRQQTQGEVINLTMLYERLGNPFSVRRIPFSVLRDMVTDPMINFALYFTKVPLVRADWYIESPDAQLAAAVDTALRPVNAPLQTQICGKLSYGYQPMCKRFKLGELRGFYRDPYGEDPEKDIVIWDSKEDALLWDKPYVLAPEHCMPRWNERGDFAGFYYSIVPLPNPIQVGLANLYGYAVVPGFEVGTEFAMWPVNEQDENFGSLYGSPRTKRAYRYFWSYWYRWALADRSFENLADPVKRIYYPTEYDQVIDSNDPDLANGSEIARHVQARALSLGQQMRAGATLALPGDFAKDGNGNPTSQRLWDADYIEAKGNFAELSESFGYLDSLKFRSMLVPEQAFISGQKGATGGTGSGSSSRLMGVQLGEVYQQSQQLLAEENDAEINRDMIPQWVAANFPDKAGTPCRKVTRGFGAYDTELIKQIIQLVGQVKGSILPVDIREMLRQAGMPLLTEKQQKQQEEQIAEEAAKMQPAPTPPQRVGMQGYNAGVEKTSQGLSVYVQPPERIDLSTLHHEGLLGSLPEVPAYKDASIRASMMKLRKMMLDRYKQQVESFIEHVGGQTSLHLAAQAASQNVTTVDQSQPGATTPPQQPPPSGLSPAQAAGVAGAIVSAWLFAQGADDAQSAVSGTLLAIANRGALRELKLANLGNDALDIAVIEDWAKQRASFVVDSIDSTIQDELKTFLTNELQKRTSPEEVAQAAQQRFEDTAQTHADRVVLTETLPAYNHGALTAFQSTGVGQVMAHDASNGRNQLTDPECKQRNGKIMSVDQALDVASEVHPHDTLWFSPLSTDNFTIERVDTLPSRLNGRPNQVAAYDRDKEVLFVLADVNEEDEQEFALAVGSVLQMR